MPGGKIILIRVLSLIVKLVNGRKAVQKFCRKYFTEGIGNSKEGTLTIDKNVKCSVQYLLNWHSLAGKHLFGGAGMLPEDELVCIFLGNLKVTGWNLTEPSLKQNLVPVTGSSLDCRLSFQNP